MNGHFKVALWRFLKVVRLAQEARKLASQSQGYADLAQELARIYNWDGILE
mgnify:CR=1 FL=1